jgi:hypothetical protein
VDHRFFPHRVFHDGFFGSPIVVPGFTGVPLARFPCPCPITRW